MNAITFSGLEAISICKAASIHDAIHVEIKREGAEWSMYCLAKKTDDTWQLYGIRYGGPMDVYPKINEITSFMECLDTRLQELMNKLIPSFDSFTYSK